MLYYNRIAVMRIPIDLLFMFVYKTQWKNERIAQKVRSALLRLLSILISIQLIPIGRDHLL